MTVFPSPPGTFLLSIEGVKFKQQKEIIVSVPTGDFSFIYASKIYYTKNEN